MAKLLQQELERHLWGAADILRGTVDAGDYKQYIFGLLFYKRLCDVWDEEFEALLLETGDREEAADPDEHRFHVPAEHRWDAVRHQSTQIGQRLNNALAAIEDANLRLRGVFGSVDFANQDRFSDALLEKLLAHFEKHRLRNADVPADMLGDAYLYLIKMFAEGAGKKGGEFYTPRSIVRLMVEIIDPRPGMSVYDPTCGSAGMLLEAAQYLKDRGENARSLSLYGQEKNFATWGIAEINLFLHDVDDAFIAKGDTILSPKRYDPKAREFVEGVGAYDRVLANPPFSEKVWGYEVWQNGDPFGRDEYGCPPKGYGDLAFVQHMLASLKDDGMLAVVVPHGVLFRSGAEGRIREAMLTADVIEAVVGLAPNLFYGASIPAALLICRKEKPADRRGKVLIVNGDATYQPGNAQNFLTDEHVRTLAEAVHGFADIDKLARVVTVEEIVADKYNLNISRYVKTGADAEVVDLAAEVLKLQDLLADRSRLEGRMMDEVSRLIRSEGGNESWDRRTLGSLFDFINGCAFKPEDWSDAGTPIIRIQNLNGSKSFNFYEGDIPAKYHVSAGDLLFCWSGSRGTSFGARKWDGPLGYLNQHIFRCVVSPDLDFDFAYYLLEAMTPAIEAEAHGGGGLVHIKKSEIVRFEAEIPTRPEQESIARVMASIDKAILANNAVVGCGGSSVGGLSKVKKHLLKSLLSGHVRVPT